MAEDNTEADIKEEEVTISNIKKGETVEDITIIITVMKVHQEEASKIIEAEENIKAIIILKVSKVKHLKMKKMSINQEVEEDTIREEAIILATEVDTEAEGDITISKKKKKNNFEKSSTESFKLWD